MFNRPTSVWTDQPPDTEWNVDRNPLIRLIVMWIVMTLPLLAVCGRVAQLQLSLQDGFASAFQVTTESREEIPARDGRILSADGVILADNVEQFDIAVYFPQIETTADQTWLTSLAKSRLRKSDWKNRAKLAAEKQRIVDEHDRFWLRLANLTDRSPDEIASVRRSVQSRVEQIKESIKRRHQTRQSQEVAAASDQSKSPQTWWQAAWQRIQQQAAEPPVPVDGPRLIAEERDYHTVVSNVSADVKAEIESHRERYPNTRIVTRTSRVYPQGELAAHLIGYRKPLTDEQLQNRKAEFPLGDPQDYRLADPCGQDGLEKTHDLQLKGVRGQRLLIKQRGEVIETKIIRDARHGQDLRLTLNAELQQFTEQLLKDALTKTISGTVDPEATNSGLGNISCPQGAGLVALDVHTGAVIAAASEPGFDLNLMVSADSQAWDDLVADRRSPLISRVTKYPLPPGSVFKPITAVAALESRAMSPDEPFYCQGYLDKPNQFRCLPFVHQHVGHGDVTLHDALCRSCNVYFYTAARRMGPETLIDWARQFGIGQPTGIDLPSESGGYLPAPEEPKLNGQPRKRWLPGDTLGIAIGQSEVEVTPLQMARMMAAIANNGYLVTPRLAAPGGSSPMDESDQSSRLAAQTESRPIRGLHRSTLDHIREGLTMVVHDPHGTGYKTVRMKEVTIAGKTGTAQTNGVDHAWFAGYVPAEQPRIAFVVVLEHGGGGGKVAGPVAHDFVKKLVDMGLVTKTSQLVSEHRIPKSP